MFQTSSDEDGHSDEEFQFGEPRQKTEWTSECLQRLLADAITYKSSLEEIEVILRCGGNANMAIKRGLRPLHYAAYVNFTECVEYLIELGADVNVTDDIGYTPLHLCARRGFSETMGVLIKNGAVLNYCGSEDKKIKENTKTLGYMTYEPLNMSIENNHVECVRLLLKSGAKPNTKYFMGHEINLVPFNNLLCFELLLQYGADPNVFNRCGMTPLMKACRESRAEVVKLLIAHGADLDMVSPPKYEQKTALHYAIQSGSVDIIKILVQHGACLSSNSEYKYSPLHSAVLSDRVIVCRLLLEHGADVNDKTEEDISPLVLACATSGLKQRFQIAQLLLENNADVNVHSPYISYTEPCSSPLTEYLKNTTEPEELFVKLLIQYGASVKFCCDMTLFKVTDPFGVLNYLPKVTNTHILTMLLEASCLFDKEAIRNLERIPLTTKKTIMDHAERPRDLKQLVRLAIRNDLSDDIPHKIRQLPLPSILKSYVLFENV